MVPVPVKSMVPALAAAGVAAVVWYSRPGRLAERYTPAASIFVSIASYRDTDCARTLRDLFTRASDPKRVFVGVCEQNTDAVAEACLVSEFPWHAQVRRISLPHKEARGPTYARYLCSTLYRGETYFCQIDSHTRFVQGWDDKVVEMHGKCATTKAVLTHYPHDVDQIDNGNSQVPVLCRAKFNERGVPVLEAVTLPASDVPRPVPFASGGFLFGPGSMVSDVPYDPDLPHLFQGEEILYSARLWTSGYDFYTPTENVVYHHYVRSEAAKYWNDVDHQTQQVQTVDKVKRLLTGKLKKYAYGMGTVRSLDDYLAFARLDMKASTSTTHDTFCAR